MYDRPVDGEATLHGPRSTGPGVAVLTSPAMRQQIRFCTTGDNVRLAFATSGQGSPLVKVAHWLSHVELDWQSPLWRHWLKEVAGQFRLIRYDGRGSGLSDWNIPPLSFDHWVRDLETVVDAAGLETFPLLGLCRGAAVAVAYAARHPERVSHLILQGGYARGRLRRGGGTRQQEEANMMVKLVELGWGADNPAGRQFFATQNLPDGTPDQHRSFTEIARLSASPENAAAELRQMYEIDVTEMCRSISCPTLVFHSERDGRVPFEEGRLLASLIPEARFVSLPSRNHFLVEGERAWRTWLDELSEFLAPVRGQPVLSGLTRREREILALVAQGLSNSQIAASLELSVKTIKNHLTSLFDKLGVEQRAKAIVLAHELGLARSATPD